MAFIPENELERVLVQAAHNPASAQAFYRLLLDSELLVLGSVAGHEGATEEFSLSPGGQIQLVTGENNGSRYLPVFSSLSRMQDYVRQESKYLRVNGRALLDLTRGAPVILNPASEYGKQLTPEQVQQLLDGPRAEPRIVEGQGEPPPQLLAMLSQFFVTRPDIEAAWMTMVAPADRAHEIIPLLGIETTSATQSDWPQLMQALQAAAGAVPDAVFDVQRVDRRNPAGVAAALLQTTPIYQRRSLN